MEIRDILIQTYKGKKVFVTGHTGFKGSWLILSLNLLGADVRGYALDAEDNSSLFNVLSGNQLCRSIIADIRDKDRLLSEILDFQPDFIFHLAAQPLVRLSYEQPSQTFETNVIGTSYVMEGMRLLSNPCAGVFITTDKVYHNLETGHSYSEEDRLGGHDPYSASKACCEILITSYRNSFFNSKNAKNDKAIASARAGNVIGGGDWSKDRLIPDIARSLYKKQEIIIRNPLSVRPWQHVMEPLTGYLLLGAKLKEAPEQFSEAYNFGPYSQDTCTVKEMVEDFIQEWGEGSYSVVTENNSFHEASLLHLNISKAIGKLGWKPALTARQAVRMTVEWYKCYEKERSNIYAKTKEQAYSFLNNESIL